MTERMPSVEIYKPTAALHQKPRFYWRLRAANGEIIADGAESYTRRAECKKAVERARDLFGKAEIEVMG